MEDILYTYNYVFICEYLHKTKSRKVVIGCVFIIIIWETLKNIYRACPEKF